MRRPVRTTLVYGLASALAVMPATIFLAGVIGWPLAFKLLLWLNLSVYALLLTRWSGKGPGKILFPLFLLLVMALWPGFYAGFFLLGLGVLCWIRSGICFSMGPVRAAVGEALAIGGGSGLVMFFNPGSSIAWAISIWLFFLMQALYFFIVPLSAPSGDEALGDTFERAHREALRLLQG
jgi:hypothetical protein